MRKPEPELLSLSQMCDYLGISVATGRNWLRRGQMTAQEMRGRSAFFTRRYAAGLKRRMTAGSSRTLKQRRNKNYVSGSRYYDDYLDRGSVNARSVKAWLRAVPAEERRTILRQEMILAEAALQMLCQRFPEKMVWKKQEASEKKIESVCFFSHLEAYLNQMLDLGEYTYLIEEMVPVGKADGRRERWLTELQRLNSWPKLILTYEPGEDVLGLLYLSCRKMAGRKTEGAYYTPAWLVHRLLEHIQDSLSTPGIRICDPCCGTGNFLIQLPDTVKPEQIFGNDVDPTSAALTRINLVLRYPETDPILWKMQITDKDYLLQRVPEPMDLILGNPPWGSHFTEKTRKRLQKKYQSAQGKAMESCDLVLERALNHLKPDGVLALILPESVLQVRTHERIREILREKSHLTILEYLDNPFHEVQCPSMILVMRREEGTAFLQGMTVYHKEHCHVIAEERSVENWNPAATDEEYRILTKIQNVPGRIFLKDHAEFALGIVTGNNRELLVKKRSKEETIEKREPILRGSDIEPFRIRKDGNMIHWNPKEFQQVAPESSYRAAPKLVYRFVCDHPVMAVDREGRVTLNSCNLVIPGEDTFPAEVLAVLFNSQVAAWYWRKRFRTMKILRQQLEHFPIPPMSEADVEYLVSQEMMLEQDNLPEEERQRILTSLEVRVAQLYGLKPEE